MRKEFALMVISALLFSCSKPDVPAFDQQEMLPGGQMTAVRLSHRTFVEPGRNMQSMEKLEFFTGFSLFRDPWVIAPSSTTDRDGLGPLFNTRSCISCHTVGGRGPLPEEGESKPSALVIRLGATEQTQPMIDPVYGGQIQPRAIHITSVDMQQKLPGEAQLILKYLSLTGSYADGSEYNLQQPRYQLSQLAYGDLHPNMGISPRFAPVVYGTGLLDAIADSDLLAQEDVDDADNDGISARYNRVPQVETGTLKIGRFGHKAKHPSLAQQVAAAFRDDIGITNRFFSDESCSQYQEDCFKVSALGGHKGVEIPDHLLDLVIKFNRGLAVPPARGLDKPQALQGRTLFYQSGCEGCHTASYITAKDYPVKALAGQRIWPYTDLALHDMGEALADGVREYSASGREWRTPPLWGLGLALKFRKKQGYLHDGRARSLEEAILWHGGEAEQSKQLFKQLNQNERQAMIAFLKAI